MEGIAELIVGLPQPEPELVRHVLVGDPEHVRARLELEALGGGQPVAAGLSVDRVAVGLLGRLEAVIDAVLRLKKLTAGLGELDRPGLGATDITSGHGESGKGGTACPDIAQLKMPPHLG